MALKSFEKLGIDFVGPINPLRKKTGARYIIISTDYVTIWVEVKADKDCNADTTMHFIFEHILTKFGCPKILMSDRGANFINVTIEALTKEFKIHHAKSTPYHP